LILKNKVIAILSFWPLIYTAIYFAAAILIISLGDNLPEAVKPIIKAIDLLSLPTFWLFLGMVIFYLLLIFKHKIIPEEKRLNWAAAIFFMGLISIPIFWFKHVRNNENAI
jgi:hypothetical protein